MLLPSDVARLVLGYLQQEGLTATSRAFILESPNLREYAEHSSEDGVIPACVFSLFGKNLTTILNEYIAVKAKETCQENQIPAMMTSLWKKLDFTLNQIKSMQNSPAVQHIQRLRTQNSIQSMRHQRALSSTQPPGGLTVSTPGGLTVSTPGHCVVSPVVAPQSMLGHSTPVCYTSQHARPSTISISQPGESTLQIIVPDHRIGPGPLSPARRKCDSPRRRGGSQYGTIRATAVSSSLTVESHSQEAMTENLSQMVIENAREKILNDRSLQEKLAENINKILASENSPQMSKAVCSAVEQEQSIDEILGLQGEIHMTDDAIQDILQQTESDPAFQALFDLFDCGKGKPAEGAEPIDGSLSNGAQESDEPGLGDSAMDTGTGLEESTSGRETSTRKLRSRSPQVQKSKRKSALPLGTGQRPRAAAPSRALPKRTTTTRGSRQSKEGPGSRGRAAGPRQQGRGGVSNVAGLQNQPLQNTSDKGASMMEVDDPSEMSEELDPQLMLQTGVQDSQTNDTTEKVGENTPLSDRPCDPTPDFVPDALGRACGAEGERTAETAGEQCVGRAGSFHVIGQSTSEPSTHCMAMSIKASWQQPATNNIPLLDMCTQKMGGGPKEAQPSCSGSASSELSASVALSPAAISAPSVTVPAPLAVVSSSSVSLPAPSVSVPASLAVVSSPSVSVPASLAVVSSPSASVPAPSASVPASLAVVSSPSASVPASLAVVSAPTATLLAPLAAVPAHLGNAPALLTTVSAPSTSVSPPLAAVSALSSTTSVSHPQTTEPDPSKIVALKIIISDDQEEQAGDSALSQAVSSITGDRIPTIFLSSPAKSPSKVPPNPSSIISPEETAQAVSNLQGAEAARTQLSHTRPGSQEAGFIQLLPANPAFGGASGYFVVTDPVAVGDQPSGMMLLPGGATQGPSTCTSHVVATPPRSRAVVSMAANVPQSFSPASSIIISSPVQPVLQNMTVSMSVFGQDSLGKLTVLPNQMLALPGPTVVNQPTKIVPKPKLLPKDMELGKTGISGSNQASNICRSSAQLKSATEASPSHRRMLCFDENAGRTGTTPRSTAATASRGVKERTRTEGVQPCVLGTSSAKRRVETIRLSEPSHTSGPRESENASVQQQQETAKGKVAEVPSSSAQKQDASMRSEPKRRPQSTSSVDTVAAAPLDPAHSLKSPSQSPRPKPSDTLPDASREQSRERRVGKVVEGAQGGSTSQDSPGVTANKENEVEGGRREPCQVASPPAENFGSSTARPPTPVSVGKPLCKTSPLTKQAVEMLQDIQSQSPTATPSRRKGTICLDLPVPRTPGPGRVQEDSLDGLRTPSRLRHGREAEGTPRHLPPPATPDLPSCSPASEAGSENSINMAAHTLMILSRAARTGGPLKDSLRQEEAGVAKPIASNSKKRKHTEPSPTAKKELQLAASAGSKKKAQKRKKLLDSFPRDLDVDKFLSSLHYDE